MLSHSRFRVQMVTRLADNHQCAGGGRQQALVLLLPHVTSVQKFHTDMNTKPRVGVEVNHLLPCAIAIVGFHDNFIAVVNLHSLADGSVALELVPKAILVEKVAHLSIVVILIVV